MNQLMTLQLADDWLAARDSQLAEAMAIGLVDSEETFEASAKCQAALQKLLKTLDEERKKVTRPIDDAKKSVMEAFKAATDRASAEINRLKSLNSGYLTRMAAEREAAERARREAEAEAALAEEEAMSARECFPGAVPVAAALPEVPRATTSASLAQVKTWDYEVIDPSVLARKFLSPDPAKIKAYMAYLKASGADPAQVDEPGLKFVVRITTRVK